MSICVCIQFANEHEDFLTANMKILFSRLRTNHSKFCAALTFGKMCCFSVYLFSFSLEYSLRREEKRSEFLLSFVRDIQAMKGQISTFLEESIKYFVLLRIVYIFLHTLVNQMLFSIP